MNKKISQFELTNTLYDQDLITVVQSNENKNITVSGLTTSLSNTFSTNDELSTVSSKIDSQANESVFKVIIERIKEFFYS